MNQYPIIDRLADAMLGMPVGEFYYWLKPDEYTAFRKEFSAMHEEYPGMLVTLTGTHALEDTVSEPIGVRLVMNFDLSWKYRRPPAVRAEAIPTLTADFTKGERAEYTETP